MTCYVLHFHPSPKISSEFQFKLVPKAVSEWWLLY